MTDTLTLQIVQSYFANVPFAPDIIAIAPVNERGVYPVTVRGMPESIERSMKKQSPEQYALGYNNELLVEGGVMCLRYSW